MHYYTRSGEKAYTVIGKNGIERDTNIGDARKLNLLPSVTTILAVLDKPQLNKWSREKVLEAVIEVGDIGDYHGGREEWEKEVWSVYKQKTTVYSTKGSEVHQKLEGYFKTGELEVEDEELLLPAIEVVQSLGYNIAEAEPSFASEAGYGGQIDLILHPDADEKPVAIIDFKTRQGEKLDKRSIYDSYLMQISAYRYAVEPDADCYNLLISQTHPGVTYLHKYEEEELERGLQQFLTLLEYWKLVNNYQSEFTNE